MGNISTLSVLVIVVGLWTPSSGCPAQLPRPAETYQLNDDLPDYSLGPVCEPRPGVPVVVVTPCSSCSWFIDGSQPSADQPYAHPSDSSILLQPFDLNLRNTIITCICPTDPTKRYRFEIGDVCGKSEVTRGGKCSHCIVRVYTIHVCALQYMVVSLCSYMYCTCTCTCTYM